MSDMTLQCPLEDHVIFPKDVAILLLIRRAPPASKDLREAICRSLAIPASHMTSLAHWRLFANIEHWPCRRAVTSSSRPIL